MAARKIRACLALALALLFFGSGVAAGAPPVERLGAALRVRALRGAKIGAFVVRADDGAVLFSHHADVSMTPASNEKILTAVAALATFGPTHRFVSTFYADRRP